MRTISVVTLVAALGLVAGCGSAPEATAEGPTVVCGTTWRQSAFYDATRRLTVVRDAGNRPLSFLVAVGCAHGSVVRWVPRSAARLVQIARARDGLVKAITLKPARPDSSFRLTVMHDGKLLATVRVRPAS